LVAGVDAEDANVSATLSPPAMSSIYCGCAFRGCLCQLLTNHP
jgi:hypothetical protein